MGDIADDHFVALYWQEGTGYGSDFEGVYDSPAFGGMNAFISRHTERRSPQYFCKFCGKPIGFINRKAYNQTDGTPHTCLRDSTGVLRVNPKGSAS